MAGKTVVEGAFQIKINPFARRLVTRCIAIIPAFIVAVAVSKNGLANALTALNYILTIGLVFVVLPVVWYVTYDKYMVVLNDEADGETSLKLGTFSKIVARFNWVVVIFTAIATVVLLD